MRDGSSVILLSVDWSDLKVEPRLSSAATIPSRFYTDLDVLDRENELVFGNTWQLVGHASQVDQTGRYFTATVANEPVLIARSAGIAPGRWRRARARVEPFAAVITAGATVWAARS